MKCAKIKWQIVCIFLFISATLFSKPQWVSLDGTIDPVAPIVRVISSSLEQKLIFKNLKFLKKLLDKSFSPLIS